MSEPLTELQSADPGSLRVATDRLVLARRDHPLRGQIEDFVESRYLAAFGARLHGHYGLIAVCLNSNSQIGAAAGLRFAKDEPLFLEQYLDEPVEQSLAAAFGRPVARDGVVEIGAFAAVGPAPALALFGQLCATLGGRGRFAVATARPELRRLLSRAFPMTSLAIADPSRLNEGASDWGRYYDAGPEVLAGAIRCSEALPTMRRRLQERELARRVRGGRSPQS